MSNLIPSYINAVQSIVGVENVAGTVTGPVKDLRFYNNAKPPTEEAIQAKLAELQAEYDANKYQRDRIYPSIGEQLDMQYWDKKNGTKKWQEAVSKVKGDHPKPTE